jgi:PAS domain S-box-containing protein
VAVRSEPQPTASGPGPRPWVRWPTGTLVPVARTWAWIPIPLLLAALLVVWVVDPPGVFESPRLLVVVNFTFSTLASLFVADLVARAFVVRGSPGLLLLGCGMVIWGCTGLASSAVSLARGSAAPNVIVTIHNLGALTSAACHLAGVIASITLRRRVRATAVWVPVAYLGALVVVALVSYAAHDGWTPPFFAQGSGGTLLRQWVIGLATAMFGLAAALLWSSTRSSAVFGRWYAQALGLVTVGLLGVMLQASVGSWVGWIGRASQYLGGVYMVVAALLAMRESRAWGASVELALRDTERRYEALFTSSLDAILLGDAGGRLVAANPAACALFGRTEAEICKAGRSGLLAPETDLEGLLRQRDARGQVRAEVQFLRRDGSRFDAELGSVTLDRAGRAFDIVRDVTERKRAEQALREADRRKEHFLAVLSHELRNPLMPIRNSIEILRQAAPGGEAALRAQEVIVRQVGQLSRLVDDLLDVTRISSDRIQLRRHRLELRELVRRTVEDHASYFRSHGVALELQPAEAPVHVDADPHRLAQVVGNLLLNAAKFTGQGGRTWVTVSADPGAGEAHVVVADDGVGLSAEMLACLFQPFVQADETLDRSEGGLGLGLALVKGLVELHGGTITARSEGPGTGARFEMTLPLCGPPAQAEARSTSGVHPRRRVMVVDDNQDAAQSLRELLELQGHQVVAVAHEGADALAEARRASPEVVLCDIGLPGMDGYQVARAFRADPALRATRLVALSGYAQPEDLRLASEAGFDAHLAKPADLDRLEQLLAAGERNP